MQLYWSWKKLPELQHRSKKEFRQAVSQIGLKPFRHWPVWGALWLSSLLILLWLETVFGFTMNHAAVFKSEWQEWLLWSMAILAAFGLNLPYRHAYLSALRRYIPSVVFEPTGSWWKAAGQSALVTSLSFVFIVLGMSVINWVINYYDKSPDPRYAAIKTWPEPVPEGENGFIAQLGLMTADAEPFAAGRGYVAAVNAALLKHAEEPPQPSGLVYHGYTAKPESGDTPKKKAAPYAGAVFCKPEKESCWHVLRQERNAVLAWQAANKVLAARYAALQKYPRWQYPLTISRYSSIPNFQNLIRGQALLQAAAMQAIEKGQARQGLAMLGDDMRFVKRMLEGKDMLLGKMIATAMLTKDLALLAQTAGEYPEAIKKNWPQIEEMMAPLTVEQISIESALRFELQFQLSIFDGDLEENLAASGMSGADEEQKPMFMQVWLHHLKKNASINLLLENGEEGIKVLQVADASVTKPVDAAQFDAAVLANSSWYYNQVGQALYRLGQPAYNEYANKLFDLNALNNLVRVQLLLRAKRISANEVPAFLGANGSALWNPETALPFEWDAQRKQVYFIPATDFRDKVLLGGVKGRIGITVD